MNYENHSNQINDYIEQNHCESWNIANCRNEGITVDICDNGDVHYNSFTIIKTGIKLN